MKLKQFNLGRWFGALRIHAQSAQFYVALIQLFLVAAAAIRTIQEWFDWVTYPMLIIALITIYLLAILFDHIFVYKSVISYTTGQAYIDENPAVRDLKHIKRELSELKELIVTQSYKKKLHK